MVVLYVAFGDKYLVECLQSIRSVRSYNDSITIVVYTSIVTEAFVGLDVVTVVRRWDAGYLAKIRAMKEINETDFLFLDTDTYVTGDIAEVFSRTREHGFSAAIDPLLDTRKFYDIRLPWIEGDLGFEFNSGVIRIARQWLADDFFEEWENAQNTIAAANPNMTLESIPDQISLKRVVEKTSMRYNILPDEYNFRACYPQIVRWKPLIIHSRIPNPLFVARRLRNIDDLTVWFPFGATVSRGGFSNRLAFFVFRTVSQLRHRIFRRCSQS